ncbi:zinc-dependent peptidase [Winogradskyella sp. F6397]|uniref:Zinc-dependent peptidase n=1 Tax=Winogradskyella marina TaxID=2785530 RepID=A0ABS0EDQ6_9FLAO|nr:zinc-dependent peptidase [Winogradskyella marina]MBF8148524.1 zinc-dependent peptidase [Winogradskyella marina]
MMISKTEQELFELEVISNYIIPIGVVLIVLFILYRLMRIFQLFYASTYNKPLFVYRFFKLSNLPTKQKEILENEHSFFGKLSNKHQRQFEHRVSQFIQSNTFIGKQELEVTDQMKVKIAATASMLCFGFKKHQLDIIENVIIYPNAYYSQTNKTFHKGEVNPKLKTIVFSWKDFQYGYEVGDDNLNLGIHEFGHAIHLNASMNNDVSSIIFNQGYNRLVTYLQEHETLRQQLIASKYFRAYAYTNQYEFFAVLLENFIETPSEFKLQFPELYKCLKQMLNFKFAGY